MRRQDLLPGQHSTAQCRLKQTPSGKPGKAGTDFLPAPYLDNTATIKCRKARHPVYDDNGNVKCSRSGQMRTAGMHSNAGPNSVPLPTSPGSFCFWGWGCFCCCFLLASLMTENSQPCLQSLSVVPPTMYSITYYDHDCSCKLPPCSLL